jgi:thiol-disulfide isomerase/thioredoxin
MTANLPNSPQPHANRLRNLLIAVVAIVLTAAFAIGLKTQTSAASLPALAKASVPLEVALRNEKPTFMEFYADWCTSCQKMAPDIAALKATYSDRVNFVMLNVDNEKWLPEIVAYRVDGIPHFVYLQADNEPVAQAIGEQPEKILEDNLLALADGQPLPIAIAQGETSAYSPPSATKTATQKATPDDPRAHGAQVKNSV